MWYARWQPTLHGTGPVEFSLATSALLADVLDAGSVAAADADAVAVAVASGVRLVDGTGKIRQLSNLVVHVEDG
jgi:hypothetical protein